jgi:serine protease Do
MKPKSLNSNRELSALCASSALALTVALMLPVTASAQVSTPLSVTSPRGLPDFTDLVDLVGPSVVNIRTLERVSDGADTGADGMDDQMREFFRRFGIPVPPGLTPRVPRQDRGAPNEPQPRGVGSGFILSPDGLIMTNAHVVEGADELLVTLSDKREFKAKVVGSDKRTDVAVVKIEATGLNAVKIGDVNRLRVGEWVMAIGSPFGLDNTVTAGIVSAKKRDTGDFLPFIQTDVAINPGNSGGPLLNMRGEVVGINSQIYSRSGGFQGISFAIPIDEAVRVADQLRVSGRVTRGRIGVQIDQVSKEVAESIGLGKPKGALVRGVEDGSPAAKAGVQPGDIIVKFDGKDVDNSVDLPRLVGNTRPGTKSRITVYRRGAQRELGITVGELEPDASAKAQAAPDAVKPKMSNRLQRMGLVLAELTDSQKRSLNLPSGGVRVQQADGLAASAGLREGDVIVAINNEDTGSLAQVESALANVDGDRAVNILFRRGDWSQYTLIRPGR